ncbi:MAG: hypothetical protein K2U26_03565 [Cyclobacteriaceae bacterium]|nr:hypothetical protein [Cyclobacteriaceae bacterium]
MAKKIVWTKRANSKFNKIIDRLECEWSPIVTQGRYALQMRASDGHRLMMKDKTEKIEEIVENF